MFYLQRFSPIAVQINFAKVLIPLLRLIPNWKIAKNAQMEFHISYILRLIKKPIVILLDYRCIYFEWYLYFHKSKRFVLIENRARFGKIHIFVYAEKCIGFFLQNKHIKTNKQSKKYHTNGYNYIKMLWYCRFVKNVKIVTERRYNWFSKSLHKY